jgi:pimeloyl-ACP methyl ester carboxylesterase
VVRSRYRQVWFAPIVALTLVGTGCSVGPSQRPPVAVRGDSVPAAPVAPISPAPGAVPDLEAQNASIPFSDCTADTLATLRARGNPTLRFDCGELMVPADPAAPQLGTLALGVLRAGPAGAPLTRPPLLVVGDSAGDASARVAALLAEQVSPELLGMFTLVGLDRRGAGADRLDCAPSDARAALVDADPARASAPTLARLLEDARSVVQECNLTLDSSLGAVRSASTASDVELLRAALGVGRLSAIGTGDGAGALATWAGASPQAVGRLVLDGPPQPGLDEPDRSEARAKAAETAFDAFAVSCTARPGCPLGATPRSTVTALVKSLGARPLAAADGRRLTAGSAVTALRTVLGEPRDWPALAAALAAAAAGEPTPLLNLLDPLTGPRGRFDGALATDCNDSRNRLSPARIAELATRWAGEYPLFGGEAALGLVDCAPWPTGGVAAAAPAAAGAPPMLVLGTAADSRDPLDGSRRASDALPSARFLSWQGAGTGAYPRTPCVTGVVDELLVDGVLPQADTLCPP